MLEVSFFLKGHHGLKSVPRNPPDCTGLDNWVFDNFILADELFAKALQRFASCLSVSNNSCGKLAVSSLELPIMFDDNFRVAPVSFVTADFKLLSCESDNFTYIESFYTIIYNKWK